MSASSAEALLAGGVFQRKFIRLIRDGGVSFFFNDTASTEIYTLSLHDALPISVGFMTGLATTTWHGALRLD